MPTSMTRNAADAETRWNRCSRRSGTGPRSTSEPDDERPDQERERGEEHPAGEVVAPGRPGGADRIGRRRRGHSDAEGEDTGRRVPVVADHAPANGVRLAPLESGHRSDDDMSVVLGLGRTREHRPVGREHLDRVRA